MKRMNLLFLGLFAMIALIGAISILPSCTIDPGVGTTNYVSSTGASASSSSSGGGGGADSNYYTLYSETYTVDVLWAPQAGQDGVMEIWNNGFSFASDFTTFSEGAESLKLVCLASDSPAVPWAGLGLRTDPLNTLKNLSAYSAGYLNFMYKSTKLPTKIGIKGGTTTASERWITGAVLKSTYGLKDDGTWSSVRIPLTAFSGLSLTTITYYFMFVTDGANHVIGNQYNIDNIYFSTN